MKNNAKLIYQRVIKVFVIIIILICAALVLMEAFAFVVGRYGGYDIATRKQNMLLSGLDKPDVCNEICYLLEKYNNWNNLFLTDKFKNKFRNRQDVIKDINDYKDITGGYDYDEFNRKVVVIFATKKKNIVEIFNTQDEDITTEFYFDFQTDQDGWIDDLTLLKRIDVDSTTGK